MPRPPTHRTRKRPPPSNVYPSPMTVEFVSFTKEESGRVTKKRIVQKSNIDLRSILDAAHDLKTLSSPTGADLPQAEVDNSSEPMQEVSSSAVSVSTFSPCHVTDLTLRSQNSLSGCDTAVTSSTSSFVLRPLLLLIYHVLGARALHPITAWAVYPAK